MAVRRSDRSAPDTGTCPQSNPSTFHEMWTDQIIPNPTHGSIKPSAWLTRLNTSVALPRTIPRYWSRPTEVLIVPFQGIGGGLASVQRRVIDMSAELSTPPTARRGVPYSTRNRLTRKEHPKEPRKELGRYRCASSGTFRWFDFNALSTARHSAD